MTGELISLCAVHIYSVRMWGIFYLPVAAIIKIKTSTQLKALST